VYTIADHTTPHTATAIPTAIDAIVDKQCKDDFVRKAWKMMTMPFSHNNSFIYLFVN